MKFVVLGEKKKDLNCTDFQASILLSDFLEF